MVNRKISVCKEYKFEAAHRLTDYGGPCANLHGHSYRVQVKMSIYSKDLKNNNYMVMDFGYIDILVKDLIDSLDHSYLNDSLKDYLPSDAIPTAELMAGIFFDYIDKQLNDNANDIKAYIESVRVYETEKCYAEVVHSE